MKLLITSVLSTGILTTAALGADTYRVETIDEAIPADRISTDIAERLSPQGLRIIKGTKRTVYELWFCKDWPAKPDFKPTSERLYPFQPGDLIGAVRLRRRGSDFRDQDISRGVYTLRYGLQPIDGNHEGTSPTRDFLLMVNADQDTNPAQMPIPKMLEASAEAAQSNHPAMLCLQRMEDNVQAPALRETRQGWWVLRAIDRDKNGSAVALDLIVVGHAEE